MAECIRSRTLFTFVLSAATVTVAVFPVGVSMRWGDTVLLIENELGSICVDDLERKLRGIPAGYILGSWLCGLDMSRPSTVMPGNTRPLKKTIT